jgi:hypothetical protein
MSCDKNSAKISRAAAPAGISQSGAKSGFTAGSTARVAFFRPAGPKNETSGRKKSKQAPRPGKQGRRGRSKKLVRASGRSAKSAQAGQKPFFDLAQEKKLAAPPPEKHQPEEGQKLPTQWQVDLSQGFTPEELQLISIQLRLGGAAASRHLRDLGAGLRRGIGHGDPRPLDWIQADHQNFEFLVRQLSEARRGRGALDLSSLKKERLIDLWEFCRFETERAHRNIDHLTVPGGGIAGPTATYLIGNHQLEARFFSHIAAEIERLVPAEALNDAIGDSREDD